MKNSQAKLLEGLSKDLTAKHGRGIPRQGFQKMRAFYLGCEIFPTPSGKLEARAKCPTLSGESGDGERQTPSAKSESNQRPIKARWKEEGKK